MCFIFFFFSSRRRHTRLQGDWSSDVCSSDLTCSNDGTRYGWFASYADTPVGKMVVVIFLRSEERRVGKECRFRWSADHLKKKKRNLINQFRDVWTLVCGIDHTRAPVHI